MILLATLLEFVYVVSILDVMPVTFMMGVAVIVNIFLLFFAVYLCGEGECVRNTLGSS